MKSERLLRQLIREQLNELQEESLGSALDDIVHDLYDTTKKIEHVHELAPEGVGKAIVAGLYSDFFNKVAEFRKYSEQLKALAKKGQG